MSPHSDRFLSRRDFLARGSLGAASLAGILAARTAPALLRRRAVADVLRLAVVGTGGRGMQHLLALGYHDPEDKDPQHGADAQPQARLADVEVVAVCDAFEPYAWRGARAVRHVAGKVATHVDYRKLFETEQLDAVIVSTPDHLHVPIAIAAMEAGVDVYVEKCMANSIAQANALGDAIERTGRIVQVGHQGRQDSMQAIAAKLVQRGDLGKVTMVQCFLSRGGETSAWIRPIATDPGLDRKLVHWEAFLGDAPKREYDPRRYFEWRRYWDYSTGIAGDLMSHHVDTVHTVLGLDFPESATASGGVYYWKDGRETPDTYSCVLEYPQRDVSVTYSCNLHNNYPKRAMLFLGDEATLELSWEVNVLVDPESRRFAEEIKAGKIRPDEPYIRVQRKHGGELLTAAAPSALWLENQGLTVTERNGEIVDTTRLHHEDFYAAVRARRQPMASFAEVYGPTVATHMTVEAFRSGRRVGWDRKARKTI